MSTFVSIIISTYNRPDALKLVLNAFRNQNYDNYELIVADDGSAEPTRDLIEGLNLEDSILIKHAWHEDKGFRLAAIRNLAASRASGDLIIFVDGDCVPLPSFIRNHVKLAEPGWFGTGNRILLTEQATQRILELQEPIYRWNIVDLVRERIRGNINRFLPAISLPDLAFRRRVKNKWQGAKGCNLAFWRKDFEAVNGFDERYEGWGREDSDILIRLIRSGIKRKDMRFAAPLLHLWHAEKSSKDELQNNPLLEQVLRSNSTRAEVGLDRYNTF